MIKKKFHRRFIGDRRAVSPAISSVIMSVAIITVGLCVLVWANRNVHSNPLHHKQLTEIAINLTKQSYYRKATKQATAHGA